MQSTTSRHGALALVLALGSSLVHAAPTNTASTIQWGDCDFNVTKSIVCGNLSVPLDYSDPSSDTTLSLQLLKIPATKTPCKGSILFNFGGPGEAARQTLASFAEKLLANTGGYHDLVAFDPRGTGNTIPYSCASTNGKPDIIPEPAVLPDASNTAVGRLWARGQVVGDRCLANANVTGGLINTPFVVRDMMKVVDALGEDGLLRYWGFSYGTALGATAAAMFPDRMDKVILDAVVNVQEYYHGDTGAGVGDVDKAFSGLFVGCLAAGKDRCALAGLNETWTADDLEQATYKRLEELKYEPIVLPDLLALLDYTKVKQTIFSSLYRPAEWPVLAEAIAALLANDIPALEKVVQKISGKEGIDADAVKGGSEDATTGIRCGDVDVRTSSLAQFASILPKYYAESKLAGDAVPSILAECWQWKVEPKERYSGQFVALNSLKTKNPLLFIGNSFDPITPLANAWNMSAVFKDSVLLHHNGYGHASLAQASKCTAQAVANYFVNGTLPQPGTVCEVDTPLFAQANDTSPDSNSPARRGLQERHIGRRWIV